MLEILYCKLTVKLLCKSNIRLGHYFTGNIFKFGLLPFLFSFTFFSCNRLSLGSKGEGPEESYEVPLGKARIAREGTDLTIVALGRMVYEALNAAEQLAELGINTEIVDPRTLQPFDTDTVIQSVKKTHKAMVVHEAVRFGGMGGEIAAQIQELAFDYLDAPVARIGAPFSPVPFNPGLEQAYMPNAEKVVAQAKELLER